MYFLLKKGDIPASYGSLPEGTKNWKTPPWIRSNPLDFMCVCCNLQGPGRFRRCGGVGGVETGPTFTNVSMDNQRRKTYRTESSMGFRGFKMIVAYMHCF